MDALRYLVCLLIFVYFIVLFLRILLTWIPSLPEPLRPFARVLRALTDPLLNPLRNLLPPIRLGGMAALDLSPLVLFFGLIIIRSIICF